jgi:hypothetical protein
MRRDIADALAIDVDLAAVAQAFEILLAGERPVAGKAVPQRPSFETPCFAWLLRMRSAGLNSTLCDLIGFMESVHSKTFFSLPDFGEGRGGVFSTMPRLGKGTPPYPSPKSGRENGRPRT